MISSDRVIRGYTFVQNFGFIYPLYFDTYVNMFIVQNSMCVWMEHSQEDLSVIWEVIICISCQLELSLNLPDKIIALFSPCMKLLLQFVIGFIIVGEMLLLASDDQY